MQGITWVASYPKSGNTWLRLALAAYRNGGEAPAMNAMPSDLEAADVSDEHYWPAASCDMRRLTEAQQLQLRGAALLHIMAVAWVRPVFVKTHWARVNFEHVEVIPPALTEKAIYLVRDPRDVALSFAAWQDDDKPVDRVIAEMADRRTKLDGVNVHGLGSYLGDWSAHVASWLEREDTLTIRYEDMLADPVTILRAALKWVGVPVDEGRLRKAALATTFERLREQEEKGRFIEAPTGKRFFRKGTAGQWREDLTPEQIARIEADHGEMMSKLGYEVNERAERVA